MQQTFTLETDSLFLSISGVWETRIFMEVDWDWWIKKKLSSELTGKHRVQGMLNVISSSSRMLSSSSLTVGWKAWLINEITSHLQRRDFNRRTNQGTPQHFCEKIQHWYLKICTRTINTLRHSDGVTWGSFEMIIFTSSSDLTSETLWIIIHRWKIRIFLKSRLSPEYARTVFWIQSWFQGGLEIKIKSHELS